MGYLVKTCNQPTQLFSSPRLVFSEPFVDIPRLSVKVCLLFLLFQSTSTGGSVKRPLSICLATSFEASLPICREVLGLWPAAKAIFLALFQAAEVARCRNVVFLQILQEGLDNIPCSHMFFLQHFLCQDSKQLHFSWPSVSTF